MKPGRERCLAAELTELDAELRERLLGGIACVLGIPEHVMRQPRDAGGVTLTERLQGSGVSIPGASHEDRVAESVESKLGLLAKRSADS